MGSIRIRGFNAGSTKIRKIIEKTSYKTMTKAMKDLERVASETTPYEEGDLEMGGFNGVDKQTNGVMGWVGFEAWQDHPRRSYDFNYAIWIHEETYNLGKLSKKKASGSGLSGKSYSVGNKYLTRPHEGESPTYRLMLESDIKKALRE